MKNHTKVFLFITFCIKICLVQNLLRSRMDKVNGFFRVYDGTRYLVIFEPKKHNDIFNMIRHLIGVKSGITYVISNNCSKTKIGSFNFLP